MLNAFLDEAASLAEQERQQRLQQLDDWVDTLPQWYVFSFARLLSTAFPFPDDVLFDDAGFQQLKASFKSFWRLGAAPDELDKIHATLKRKLETGEEFKRKWALK